MERGGGGGRGGDTPSPPGGLRVTAPSAPAEVGSPAPLSTGNITRQESCVLGSEGARLH